MIFSLSAMIPLFAALIIGLMFRRVSAVIGFILIILTCSPFLSMIFVKSEWLVLILGELILIFGLTIVSLAGRLDQTGFKELAGIIIPLKTAEDRGTALQLCQKIGLWRRITWNSTITTALISTNFLLFARIFKTSHNLFLYRPYAELTAIFFPALLVLLFNQLWLPMATRKVIGETEIEESEELPGQVWVLPPLAIVICWFEPISLFFSSIF